MSGVPVKSWRDIPLIVSEHNGVKASTALLLSGPKKQPVHTVLALTENEGTFVGQMITYEDRKTHQTRYTWTTENAALETVDRILRGKRYGIRAFLTLEDFREAGGGPAVSDLPDFDLVVRLGQ